MSDVARRYDRISRFYDAVECIAERWLFSGWRRMLWEYPKGRVLEVGVGTGKNIPYYPEEVEVVAIDISEGMLRRAKPKAKGRNPPVLMRADVMSLPFKDESFDCVVSTFVFCSVPDPVVGLREIFRVLKPRGKMFLLEHVLSGYALIRIWEEIHNPITSRLFGFNLNRDTSCNLKRAGFEIIEDKKLALKDVFRFFVVRKK